MGPMRAAFTFVRQLSSDAQLTQTKRVQAGLYGSLAHTGIGHATDRAVLLGLSGQEPATVDTGLIENLVGAIRSSAEINLGQQRIIPFHEQTDLLFHRDQMYPPGAVTHHPNGICLTAFDEAGSVLSTQTYFSIGGGFIVEDGASPTSLVSPGASIPYAFKSAAELLQLSQQHSLSIADIMLANEAAVLLASGATGSEPEIKHQIRQRILNIWQVMQTCVERGVATEGILPGGLNVRRRAHRLAARLEERKQNDIVSDPLAPLDWVTVYAMAVNEENAAGGRVVTAPTNGAAGVVPAVGLYYANFISNADEAGILRYFLTSAAIGILYKENASISGAEVGVPRRGWRRLLDGRRWPRRRARWYQRTNRTRRRDRHGAQSRYDL